MNSSSTADVYATINMTQWRDKVEQEILRWRLDNNYIPIMPIPVGQQTIGGDGRALMLAQEYRVWAEHIVAGMGVPIEFVFGGMQYSGSNVSMRILENHFLDVKSQRKQLIDGFIIPRVSAFMGWEPVDCHYKRFKMADDLQRSSFYLQLNQAGKISDRSLLEDTDWDSDKESIRIDEEAKHVGERQRRQSNTQADIQGQAQLIMAKYQLRGNKLMMESGMAAQGMESIDPMQGMGTPGMTSPVAEGQMMNQQMQMQNETGQVPGMEIPPQGASPMDQVQSQVGSSPAPAPGPGGLAVGGGTQIDVLAQRIATWLVQLPDNERMAELQNLQHNNPQVYSIVLPLLQQMSGAQQSSAAMPQPEQRPARRGPESTTA